MSGIGIFSPPLMTNRTDERSRCLDVGQRHDRVAPSPARATRWSRATARSRRRRRAASKTRWMIVVAPAAMSDVVVRSSAPTWYSGPHASPRSALGEAELDDVREVLPRQVGVGEHHALRAAGGARGVHQPVHVVAGRGHAAQGCSTVDRRSASARPALGRRRRDAHAVEVAFHVRRRVVREIDERLVAHQRARFRVVEDVPQLRRGEPPVDRHRDRAEVVGGEDRLEELGAVVREQPDDVAGADAAFVQPGRERGRARAPSRRR